MPHQAALAKPARRPSQGAAGNVNFAGDSFPDPALLLRRGNCRQFLDFAHKLMSRGTAKMVIAVQNLYVRVANTSHSDAQEGPTRAQPGQAGMPWPQMAVADDESLQAGVVLS